MSQLLELEPVLVKKSPRPAAPPSPESTPASSSRAADPLQLDPVLVTPLRRPERRRARQRATPLYARPVVLRTAFAIVAAAVVASFAGRITAFAMEPVLALQRVGAECRSLEQDLAKQKGVNQQLAGDIAYYKTPAGVEQLARRLGMVKPREIALTLVVPEVPGAKAKQKEAQPVRTASNMPIADRIRSAVDTALSVFGGSRSRPE